MANVIRSCFYPNGQALTPTLQNADITIGTTTTSTPTPTPTPTPSPTPTPTATAVASASPSPTPSNNGHTFVVTKTADTADGTCDSDCSVREAFIAANAAGGGTIQIPAGTYPLAIPGGGEDASATGDFDITSAITVIGAGPDQTILDGANLDRVIDVRAGGSLNISGLTIQHGKVGHGLVAGLRADGPLVMSNVHVVNNEGDGTDADGTTGGVSINHQALITDSIISNNKTTGNSVGGLAARDGSNVTIRNTIVEGNSDTGSFPLGGILLRGQATLDNVIVRNNTADGHEPVAGLVATKASVVTIMNSQFLNNDTTGDAAVGGIFNLGEMSIWDTTVDGNKTAIGTDGVAGILSLPNDAKTNKLTLRRVIVSNNSALGNNTVGGAAIQTPADLGEVTFDHNSVTDNSTGGLKFFAANPVTLSRVKITNNSAGMSATGGLFVGGASHVTVTDSWIDHNTSAGSAEAGVDVIGGSVANFIRVGITNNSASGASATGGITVYQATGSLTNVTVSGNSAVGNATGGVYVDTGTLTIDFTTIDNNTAGNSLGVGGLTSYGTLHISNSIVGHNPGQNSCYFNTPVASEDHNIDAGNDCSFNQPTDKQSTNPHARLARLERRRLQPDRTDRAEQPCRGRGWLMLAHRRPADISASAGQRLRHRRLRVWRRGPDAGPEVGGPQVRERPRRGRRPRDDRASSRSDCCQHGGEGLPGARRQRIRRGLVSQHPVGRLRLRWARHDLRPARRAAWGSGHRLPVSEAVSEGRRYRASGWLIAAPDLRRSSLAPLRCAVSARRSSDPISIRSKTGC